MLVLMNGAYSQRMAKIMRYLHRPLVALDMGDDGHSDAYLYQSAAAPWPRVDDSQRLERLPDFLKETRAQGGGERLWMDADPQPLSCASGGFGE
jgi:hypothetical protein